MQHSTRKLKFRSSIVRSMKDGHKALCKDYTMALREVEESMLFGLTRKNLAGCVVPEQTKLALGTVYQCACKG